MFIVSFEQPLRRDVKWIKLVSLCSIVHDAKLWEGLVSTFNFHESNLCIGRIKKMLSF